MKRKAEDHLEHQLADILPDEERAASILSCD